MATHWIKVKKDLHEDERLLMVATALGIDIYAVMGRCIRLWSWADGRTEDGVILNTTPEIIDSHVVGMPGFCQAMMDVGWLNIGTGEVTIPRFEKHMSQSAKKRAVEQEKKQKQREAKASPQTVPATRGQARDESGTREEKIREESSTNQGAREPSQDWRAKSFAALSRAIGRQCDVSDDMHLERFVQTLPAKVRIRDALHDRWQLVERALSETNVSADAQTARSAIKYAKKIIERCIQHEVWPGEFENEHGKSNKPDTRAAKGKQRYAGQVDDDVGKAREL